MTKLWVDTVDPTIKRWRLRSLFPDCVSTVDSIESGCEAEILKILAEQVDDYQRKLDRAYARFKWVRLQWFLIGYFFMHLITYLTS